MCQVKGQAGVPPELALRGKIFKIWFCRSYKNFFVESLVFLTLLNQLQNFIVFVMLHSSLPKFINPFSTSDPLLYPLKTLLCSISCVNVFWFHIKLGKKGYRWQFFIFMPALGFSFSTILVFQCPNYVSQKSVYQPQINSRSAHGGISRWGDSPHLSSRENIASGAGSDLPPRDLSSIGACKTCMLLTLLTFLPIMFTPEIMFDL